MPGTLFDFLGTAHSAKKTGWQFGLLCQTNLFYVLRGYFFDLTDKKCQPNIVSHPTFFVLN
jgi:hypothetical protein